MSYILEALKKAQSERQLGSAPTIHAMPIHAGSDAGAAPRRALWPIVLAVAVLLAAAGGGVAWWRKSAPAAPAAPAAPVVVARAPVVQPAPVVAPPPVIQAPPEEAPPPPVQAAPKPAPEPAPAPVTEDVYPYLRELPEAVQREVPQVVFGGYIYSKNPADRLLLVDKVLRREGEQVAPGLVLEKLQSKAAVMNYRGTRYRIQY